MIIGKVVGTVVASRKEEELVGMKFLAVAPLDLALELPVFVLRCSEIRLQGPNAVPFCGQLALHRLPFPVLRLHRGSQFRRGFFTVLVGA